MTDEINGKIYKCPTIKGEKIYVWILSAFVFQY